MQKRPKKEKNILEVSIKRNRLFLYVGLLFLIVASIVFYEGYRYESQKYPTPINFYDLKSEKENKKAVNNYSYIDINTIPTLFAVYETNGQEENQKFYFVMDNESNLYILYMNDTTFQKLNNKNIETTPVRVYGITKKIKSDVKKTAISTYNEIMKDEYLSDDNFEKYVGSIYLDLNQKYYDAINYYLISFFLLLFFVILISIYFKNLLNNKKMLKKYKKELVRINKEISDVLISESGKSNKGDKSNNKLNASKKVFKNLYLTRNYIVRLGSKLLVVKYKEVEAAYPYESYQSGILVGRGISLVTSTKIYNVGRRKFFVFDKSDNQCVNIILEELKEKNKKIIIGYDEKNAKKRCCFCEKELKKYFKK